MLLYAFSAIGRHRFGFDVVGPNITNIQKHDRATARIARRKLSLLELTYKFYNVSKDCKVIGYSRQQFNEIHRNFQTCGAEYQ